MNVMLTLHCLPEQWRIQDFQDVGAPTPKVRGQQPVIFGHLSQKLHEHHEIEDGRFFLDLSV